MLSPSLPTSSRDFLFPFLPAGMPRHNVVAFVIPRHDAVSRDTGKITRKIHFPL